MSCCSRQCYTRRPKRKARCKFRLAQRLKKKSKIEDSVVRGRITTPNSAPFLGNNPANTLHYTMPQPAPLHPTVHA